MNVFFDVYWETRLSAQRRAGRSGEREICAVTGPSLRPTSCLHTQLHLKSQGSVVTDSSFFTTLQNSQMENVKLNSTSAI